VIRGDAEVFQSIEGNADDGGRGEGYELCKRIRGYKQKDFIRL
jgi:hypothetical protein